jgi:hypothetical protein
MCFFPLAVSRYFCSLLFGLSGKGCGGCKNIDELRAYREFVRITAAGLRGSRIRLVYTFM